MPSTDSLMGGLILEPQVAATNDVVLLGLMIGSEGISTVEHLRFVFADGLVFSRSSGVTVETAPMRNLPAKVELSRAKRGSNSGTLRIGSRFTPWRNADEERSAICNG